MCRVANMIPLTIVLTLTVAGALGLLYRLQTHLLDALDTRPPPAPPPDNLVPILRAVTEAIGTSAEAIGAAVATALTPPAPTQDELIYDAAREAATDFSLPPDDDSDPTDTTIPPLTRPDVEFAPGDVAEPFGVPGIQFPQGVS